jgi:hypothetical protein
MTPARREVRATASFFADLDRELPAERTADGRPSTNDFQVHELFEIVEQFATGFDALPELIPGRPEYRILISTSILVRAYAAIGQLAPDGAVDLIQLDIDVGGRP